MLPVAGEGGVALGLDLVPRPGQRDVGDLGDRAGRPRQGDHPVGQVDGLVDVVRDEHDRDADLLPHPQDEVLKLEPGLRVHRGEGLVHQQQVRPVGQGAGDRHPLLHAAGQLPRVVPALVSEADRRQDVRDPLRPLRPARAPGPQRQVDVAGHGEPREQRPAVVLEHDPDPGGHRAQRGALEQRLPGRGRRQPGQAAQQRGLARPARPDHAGELAPRHVERDVRQRGPRPGRAGVDLPHVPQRDDRPGRAPGHPARCRRWLSQGTPPSVTGPAGSRRGRRNASAGPGSRPRRRSGSPPGR